MTLSYFLDRIGEAVGDPLHTRYSEAMMREGLRLALEEYSRAAPQIKQLTITVETAGREQVLSGADGMLYPLTVLFPLSAGSAPEVKFYTAYLRQGQAMICIEPPTPAPQVGDGMKIIYAALHTIAGLASQGDPSDGGAQSPQPAPVTTIPLADYGLLVQGAAGHAMSMRADALVESYGKRTPQDDTFQAARRRLDDFRRRLRSRKGPEMPLPGWAGGWSEYRES
jgi:hypothetical protein